MALRGFSKFEQMFRAKLASDAPLHVLKAKKEKEGLTNEEVWWHLIVFEVHKFDHDVIATSNYILVKKK